MATDKAQPSRKQIVVGLVVLAAIVVFLVKLVLQGIGIVGPDDNRKTARYNIDKAGCMALYDTRVGHDPNDNAFWAGLVDCANAQLLPPGQNDPGFYSR